MTAKKKTKARKSVRPVRIDGPVLPVARVATEIRDLIEAARSHISTTANLALVNLYWNIGRVITQEMQEKETRAGYGKRLVERLGSILLRDYGNGFSARNLWDMKRFFGEFQILQPVAAELEKRPIGLVLCTSARRQHVELLLRHGPHKMKVAEYMTHLPDKRLLEGRLRVYSRLLKDREYESAE